MGPKKKFGSGKKIEMCVEHNFGSEKVLSPKKFCFLKIFGFKTSFGSNQIAGSKILGPQIFFGCDGNFESKKI